MNHSAYNRMIGEIRKGLALLDQYRPGWVEKVDINTLDLASGLDCIIAQVGESIYYSTNLQALVNDSGVAYSDLDANYGFSLDSSNEDFDYDDLTSEWRILVAQRQAQPSATDESLVASDEPTFSLTFAQLRDLVTRAMDAAPTRGDHSETGLTYAFLTENSLL